MAFNIRTNISQAYWCTLKSGHAEFKEAFVALGEGGALEPVSWFDRLFDGGIQLPHQLQEKPARRADAKQKGKKRKPLTLLLTGPPGSGKTTLAMELCYRLAKNLDQSHADGQRAHAGQSRETDQDPSQLNQRGLFSLYISTDAEADRLVENFTSFGYEANKEQVHRYVTEYEGKPTAKDDKTGEVIIWGRDRVEDAKKQTILLESAGSLASGVAEIVGKTSLFAGVAAAGLQEVGKWISGMPDTFWGRAKLLIGKSGTACPDIVVVDSLNIVEPSEQSVFFQDFLATVPEATLMVIFVLDAAPGGDAHKNWEYASDVVIRLDYSSPHDYYVRTIEIVKARYQSHLWGKHQLKIYKRPIEPPKTDPDRDGKLRRDNPYRKEGGIFIYPSIHSYLSRYKRGGSLDNPNYAPVRPEELNEFVQLPEGRCTAFIGRRGGHKSHLGYLHLLHQIERKDEPGGAALVISLRDDEKMTRQAMAGLLGQNFKEYSDLPKRDLMDKLDDHERKDKLEILYYHPGYITPEEFFHRMFISIQRLKHGGGEESGKKKLTVLFNSLDQLAARFPLCAQQQIFVPGIIEALTGEGATSILVAVDEKGQPVEQYGLLPMADLILSFSPHRFAFDDYFNYLNEKRNLDGTKKKSYKQQILSVKDKQKGTFREEIVLQVVRFAGGERAGDRGLLEMVKHYEDSLYDRNGLHFTPLSSRFHPEQSAPETGDPAGYQRRGVDPVRQA